MNYISQLALDTPSSTESSSNSSEGDYFASTLGPDEYGLYIAAPTRLNPVDAFRFHLTTRNLFACMLGKPIVGMQLNQALMDLLERMNELNPSVNDNLSVVLTYMDHVGYLDLRDCPDHALAALIFAERFELERLWIDAFVHCAGMNDRLIESAEFEVRRLKHLHGSPTNRQQNVSYATKALITRTRLDMEIRLEHAGRSMSNFLEDDFLTIYHDLKNDVRVHLDRFRSFLHSYYVGKYGYWPPGQDGSRNAAYSKSTFRSMYFEFRNLYEYLLDPESSVATEDQESEDVGVSVLKNITAFDRRHGYVPLPQPLPLLPQSVTYPDREQSATSLNFLKLRASLRCRKSKTERRLGVMTALSGATNTNDVTIIRCPLVQEYIRFEDASAWERTEKISAADGRKVRWILIYAILQVLVSVNQAPKEVRDTDGVSYPLCVKMPSSFPWETLGKFQPRSERRIEIEMDKKLDQEVFSLQAAPSVARKLRAKDLASITSVQPLKRKISGILQQECANRTPAEVESDSSSSRLSPRSGWSDQSAPSSDDGLLSLENLSLDDHATGSGKNEEKRSRPRHWRDQPMYG